MKWHSIFQEMKAGRPHGMWARGILATSQGCRYREPSHHFSSVQETRVRRRGWRYSCGGAGLRDRLSGGNSIPGSNSQPSIDTGTVWLFHMTTLLRARSALPFVTEGFSDDSLCSGSTLSPCCSYIVSYGFPGRSFADTLYMSLKLLVFMF